MNAIGAIGSASSNPPAPVQGRGSEEASEAVDSPQEDAAERGGQQSNISGTVAASLGIGSNFNLIA